MTTPHKKAPVFAKTFCHILKEHGKTQRQIAKECNISSSAINRLCKDGIGSDSHICSILERFNFKRRRIIEMLTDRLSELSEEPAKSYFKDFRYAFLDEDEYLREICPFPLERAYACSQNDIHILEVVDLAKQCGIKDISNKSDVNFLKIMDLMDKFGEAYGPEAQKDVFSKNCKSYPPVLLLDFKNQVDASQHVKLIKCNGKLLFGLPHLVIGTYTFDENGIIDTHRNTGGIEFLYSLEGDFELTCGGITYNAMLKPEHTIFLFDARTKHRIRLVNGKSGRLIMVRYYPHKRNLRPGRSQTN
ncbi:MAG: XRE family transcriptional regulator [Planctomycetota bacterium]|jgi:transcriptional regulator with XRE-family HTH domain/quercetin dioxygenase-like cupin family protein